MAGVLHVQVAADDAVVLAALRGPGLPRRVFATPFGSGPVLGRLLIQASTSASVQARLFGPIMRPTGKPSRSMRRFNIGQELTIPRSCRSLNRSNRII